MQCIYRLLCQKQAITLVSGANWVMPAVAACTRCYMLHYQNALETVLKFCTRTWWAKSAFCAWSRSYRLTCFRYRRERPEMNACARSDRVMLGGRVYTCGRHAGIADTNSFARAVPGACKTHEGENTKGAQTPAVAHRPRER